MGRGCVSARAELDLIENSLILRLDVKAGEREKVHPAEREQSASAPSAELAPAEIDSEARTCGVSWPAVCPICLGENLVELPENVWACPRCGREWADVERCPCPDVPTVALADAHNHERLVCPSHAASPGRRGAALSTMSDTPRHAGCRLLCPCAEFEAGTAACQQDESHRDPK